MIRIDLSREEIPSYWYNIVSDLPDLPPPIHPATKKPLGPRDFYPIFTKECVDQEFSKERYIKIPDELRELYIRIGRPTPLYRAKRLEKYLKTPAKIYYKREDVTPTGSHKLNTAIVQAFCAAREGLEYLTTETGAGQWGSALSYATAMMGIKAIVFMVRISYLQKPYRKLVMKLYGADIFPSPSDKTEIGKKYLEKDPNHPGSLGIAISEAIDMAKNSDKARYSLGSVLNHVLLHQTIIGQEVKKQFELIGEKPDILIGCFGGGSNFSGFTFPFIEEILKGKEKYDVIAVEPTAAPSMTNGEYRYDFGDSAGITPLIKMFTLGHDFIPPPIHAGGLRYHGAAPTVSLLKSKGIVRSVTYAQEETFEAGRIFAMTEGIIPAPETTYAVKAAMDEALKARENREEKVIAFNFSGHGLLDLKGYEDVLKIS